MTNYNFSISETPLAVNEPINLAKICNDFATNLASDKYYLVVFGGICAAYCIVESARYFHTQYFSPEETRYKDHHEVLKNALIMIAGIGLLIFTGIIYSRIEVLQ